MASDAIESPGKVLVQAVNGGEERALETKGDRYRRTGSDIIRLTGNRHRREARRFIHWRSGPGKGFRASFGRRRRDHWLGAWLGLAPPLAPKVTVVEFSGSHHSRHGPAEVAKQFQRLLQKQGIEFRLGQKVTGVKLNGSGPLKVPGSAKSRPRDPKSFWTAGCGSGRDWAHALHRGALVSKTPAFKSTTSAA